MKVTIYADGACANNCASKENKASGAEEAPGAWAAVIIRDDKPGEILVSGKSSGTTTNNIMELRAVLAAIEHIQSKIPERAHIHVVTDSTYVAHNIIEGWVLRWEINGWKTTKRKPVANKEMWQEMLGYMRRFHITAEWVKGHAGHSQNEWCDARCSELLSRF